MVTIKGRPSVPTDEKAAQSSSPNVLEASPRPLLSFTSDGPGSLSVSGPRHDNDAADYKHIQILPTVDEILSVHRPVYMPKKDLRLENPLPIGPGRLLDLLFRQLRCDSTESLRDICYSAAQTAFIGKSSTCHPQPAQHDHTKQETRAGNRYFLYRNVHVEELLAHEAKFLLARVSYDCPPFMRGGKMYESGRFKKGMLAALLHLDHATNELSVHFLEVHLSQSTFSMDSLNGAGRRAAVQLSFLQTSKREDVLELCRLGVGLSPQSELVLVEFPRALLAGFHHCLRRLQDMKETDFAFGQYIAPSMQIEDAVRAMEQALISDGLPVLDCPPPSYATEPGFKYDLSKIVTPPSRMAALSVKALSYESIIDRLKRETTLDAGQASAFRDCLTREFAFTQGPPGCGKTFLGVQLAKTILASRSKRKPILLVCLTNHALDSFLAELRDAGVEGLLRIGSSSKEEWTNAVNLLHKKKATRPTKSEAETMGVEYVKKRAQFCDIDLLCKGT